MFEEYPKTSLQYLHKAVVLIAFWGYLTYYFTRENENKQADQNVMVKVQMYYLWFYRHITTIGGGLFALLGLTRAFNMLAPGALKGTRKKKQK